MIEITGTVVRLMPEVKGTSKAGKSWVKQDFVIETKEQYPKKVCITAMGDKVDELNKNYIEGSEIQCFINIESREYNDKWYTNINVWKFGDAPQGEKPQASAPKIKEDETNGDSIPF